MIYVAPTLIQIQEILSTTGARITNGQGLLSSVLEETCANLPTPVAFALW